MTGLLQRVSAFDRRHPLWWDVAPIVPIAAISLRVTPDLDPLGAALLVIVYSAVVIRRRRAFLALVAAVAAVLVSGAVSLIIATPPPWTYHAIWLLLFSAGLRVRGRFITVGGLIAVTATTALVLDYNTGTLQIADRASFALAVLGMCAASYLAGLQLRTRREQIAAEQGEIARAAAINERSRIAQEMHDIIGHNLSVITSLANGGAVAVRSSPSDALSAFEAIGEVSRSSVREVRRVLTVLRHDYSADGASLSPQPGLAGIPPLVDAVRSAGLEVRLERTGDLRDISAGRQLAVYRIVQESLTNVLRHAGTRAHVSVRIAGEPEEVAVTVHDDGSFAAQPQDDSGEAPGQGVLGMRERAEMYGGTLEAGRTQTGWTVRSRIPRSPEAERASRTEPGES